MTSQVWFDGDETLWDRPGYMLTELLNSAPAPQGGVNTAISSAASSSRVPTLYPDVLPTLMSLAHFGTANLVQYVPMPEGFDDVLPPVERRAASIDEITGEDVVLVSTTLDNFPAATARGWLTIWLNRDRVSNLTSVLPDAEVQSLLDLPDALESMLEARAAARAFIADPAVAPTVALDGPLTGS